MTTHGEGHGRPESGPPGGLVDVLERWEDSGGHWQVLHSSDEWVDIGLFTRNDGVQVSRVSGARTSVLHSYLSGRSTSADQRLAEAVRGALPEPASSRWALWRARALASDDASFVTGLELYVDGRLPAR